MIKPDNISNCIGEAASAFSPEFSYIHYSTMTIFDLSSLSEIRQMYVKSGSSLAKMFACDPFKLKRDTLTWWSNGSKIIWGSFSDCLHLKLTFRFILLFNQGACIHYRIFKIQKSLWIVVGILLIQLQKRSFD